MHSFLLAIGGFASIALGVSFVIDYAEQQHRDARRSSTSAELSHLFIWGGCALFLFSGMNL